MVLRNKPPRWHEQLQCWCLNFRGRVTVASVKNFQLIEGGGPGNDSDKPCWCLNFRGRVTVASVKNFQLIEGGGPGNDSDKPVLLQFGKIDKDAFTMDYRYPLTAFQIGKDTFTMDYRYPLTAFQLIERSGPGNDSDKPVLLQCGKIGKDTFTMDNRYPLTDSRWVVKCCFMWLKIGALPVLLLQFGKIGKDTFTMDYRYPLTAFQVGSAACSG
ncbi:unnamed protein product [Closterium sp. Naga37s-1]|nr:unnamed protein product [Closterium sp. Naga37s-1]